MGIIRFGYEKVSEDERPNSVHQVLQLFASKNLFHSFP